MSLPKDNFAFKAAVKEACMAVLSERIQHAKTAMEQAQETANNQDKSSAGDKYETARAMGQLDRDMNARQLQQALNEIALLNAVDTSILQTEITKGAVFELEGFVFFIAAGLGPVAVKDKTVIVISPQSPFFQQVKSKKVHDTILFQNKQREILSVF